MNDEQYLEHCRALLAEFARTFLARTRELPGDHPLRVLAGEFEGLTAVSADLYAQAPPLVARLFDTHPEFAPTFPRQLLWFLGGDCLHYMAEEEITRFQHLDDMRLEAARRGECFNLAAAAESATRLH